MCNSQILLFKSTTYLPALQQRVEKRRVGVLSTAIRVVVGSRESPHICDPYTRTTRLLEYGNPNPNPKTLTLKPLPYIAVGQAMHGHNLSTRRVVW